MPATLTPPHDLDAVRLIFGPDGTATPKAVSPAFFEELGAEFPEFAGHMLVSTFAFDEPWGVWEMHPAGDEFVYLLEGATDMTLRTADGEQTIRVDQPGSYVVVPRGAWHTANPLSPTRMLFVTPGDGTQNVETPPV